MDEKRSCIERGQFLVGTQSVKEIALIQKQSGSSCKVGAFPESGVRTQVKEARNARVKNVPNSRPGPSPTDPKRCEGDREREKEEHELLVG